MTKSIGEQVAAMRRARGWDIYKLAKRAGCSHGTVYNVEHDKVGQRSKWPEILLEIVRSPVEDDDEAGISDPPPSGQCQGCDAILYEVAEDIPPKWILSWHLDCGGHCARCAVENNEGDVEKAREVLAFEKEAQEWV